jgi:hypothetical protein
LLPRAANTGQDPARLPGLSFFLPTTTTQDKGFISPDAPFREQHITRLIRHTKAGGQQKTSISDFF